MLDYQPRHQTGQRCPGLRRQVRPCWRIHYCPGAIIAEQVERELTRIRKSMERLLTAYQEDLLSLDELRHRVPELRAREQSMRAERQAILDQAADQISFLRLAETLTAFLQRLRQSAETLEIAERQKVAASWSGKSWSTMTPSRSGTRSRPKHQHRPPAALLLNGKLRVPR